MAVAGQQEPIPKPEEHIPEIYAQLQAAILEAKIVPNKDQETDVEDDDSAISSSNSSVISPQKQVVCPCRHLLVSSDSEHCSYCDETIDFIKEQHIKNNQVNKALQQIRSQANSSQSNLKKHTEQVHSLSHELDTKTTALDKVETSIDSLRHDIIAVETKHKDEMLHTIAIEQSKKKVEIELHELTQRLFEEANQMVLKEKKEKQEIQKLFNITEKDLNEAETELGLVQAELQKLRHDMVDNSESVAMDISPSTVHQDYLLRAQLDMSTMHHQHAIGHATTTNKNKWEALEIEAVEDDALVAEFQQFRETIDTVPLRKIQTLPFMKLCLKSDIEPCLRFGPNPKLSAKKISDAILVKSCFVEACPDGFATEEMNQRQKKNEENAKTRLWERFSNPTHSFFGCPACGRVIDPDQRDQILCWRFRISYFDEWSCIDRFCRDRIASVIEFYTFLRRLKVGVYKDAPLLGVYRECSRLKAQMFLSRMGSLPMALEGVGLDSSKIGPASAGIAQSDSIHHQRSFSHDSISQ
ncbi:hypothetical protein K501DRAFT_208410 [Backusella circina FSU 941]|nr:hypothetical protein K501DRAFT_208410 [Backusella circina FSU 941]